MHGTRHPSYQSVVPWKNTAVGKALLSVHPAADFPSVETPISILFLPLISLHMQKFSFVVTTTRLVAESLSRQL